jgi:hypothetical protein
MRLYEPRNIDALKNFFNSTENVKKLTVLCYARLFSRFNSYNFFLWAHMRQLVDANRVNNVQELEKKCMTQNEGLAKWWACLTESGLIGYDSMKAAIRTADETMNNFGNLFQKLVIFGATNYFHANNKLFFFFLKRLLSNLLLLTIQ